LLGVFFHVRQNERPDPVPRAVPFRSVVPL
jgi:hypothetical protein